ncbi:leukocidin family pore-forming toxin, partial [Staphylococcus aureus]|uniref:leukocidin family pore-forming toxin n=1 Tax=Staphylococcus aureus TaxID=1280 RepID=UPI0037DA42E2
MQNLHDNNNTSLTHFPPKNHDQSTQLKYTYPYKTPPDFSINPPRLTPNITKHTNYSHTITYQQPSYP